MTQSTRRYDTLAAAKNYAPITNGKLKQMHITEIFGEHTLTLDGLRERLPKIVWKEMKKTIEEGQQLNPSVADAAALAMKEWATELGATHYTHWFQPLTGATAEKHDSF